MSLIIIIVIVIIIISCDVIIIFRWTLLSRPNEVGLKCPSVRLSVRIRTSVRPQKKFLQFQ